MIQLSNCPHTGKKRFVTQTQLVKEIDGNIRVHRIINYFEEDNTPTLLSATGLALELFKEKEQQGTTRYNWIDPQTQEYKEPEYDQEGNVSNGVIPELQFFLSLPLSTLPGNITTVGDLITFLETYSIQVADFNGKF
jgi:hypothetical protein